MSELLKGNAVIGQSGGPTAVINQSLVGVIEGLKGHPGVEKIYGAHHAVAGIVKGDFIELQDCTEDFLNKIANSPSSALGSSRDKPDAAYCKRIFEAFEKNNVRYFFYAGGNDSSDTCRIVNELAKEEGYELRCFHVPKTVDNDLVLNDHTPGFGSAAKFVAQAFMGDNLDNRSLPGIKINIIMGRHAGFLTAASILGRRENTDDGPHLVYVPEAPFDESKFIDDVEKVYKKFGRCLIAVSEGISDKDGTAIAAKLQENVETDAHGNVQLSGSGALGDLLSDLIKDKLGARTGEKLRVRADTFGYLQRSFVGCVSEVDQAEARQAGRRAAELALSGDLDGSIAIQRVSDDPYKVEFNRIELSDVAAKTQHLDTKYVVDGCNICDSFKKYLAPIVGELPEIATFTFDK
ncbi:6-phosphofructokinase 1 [Poriferisphaera corsica]|uniref:Pyrophosphate--fructose 6-phosphate 1-phosphotransferase n=1 Tax=Poriferisphaera corsica TaxID=2528020 RepID=A0A517YYJ0_9BACT|nr:6-phosphofructokinase [Poriferisphaera corsica]QDU35294.1 6-phosphofructokinase 1 [Poriferisphaera corsica]